MQLTYLVHILAGTLVVFSGYVALAATKGATVAQGKPVFIAVVFGLPALLAGVGDVRVIRFGALTGTPRLGRHLWRMCYALFIASISFYIGQADKLPEAFRIFPLLVSLALLPLVAMIYWRLRIRRSVRGIVTLRTEPAPL